MKSSFIYIGHRGTRVNFDENTIGAFKKAIEYGADYIELDVHKSKDGKLIIIHDSSLDRTTNGSGRIKDYSYNEIKEFRTKMMNEQIPTLSLILDEFKGKIKFFIELKGEDVKRKIVKVIVKRDLQRDCVISSRSLNELEKIKLPYPEMKICYNISKGKDLTLEKFINLGKAKKLTKFPDMISLKSSLISLEFIETCYNNNILALSWDFINFINYQTALDKIKSLIELGIDGILFDNYRNIPNIKEWMRNLTF